MSLFFTQTAFSLNSDCLLFCYSISGRICLCIDLDVEHRACYAAIIHFSSSISGKELLDFLNRLLLSRVRFLKPCDDFVFGRL